jgi:hypothetical protein
LLGALGVGDGPIYQENCGTIESLDFYSDDDPSFDKNEFKKKFSRALKLQASNGTDAYVANHLSPCEVYAAITTGLDVKEVFQMSSYKKSLMAEMSSVGRKKLIKVRGVRSRKLRGLHSVSEFAKSSKKFGVLNSYPILQFVKKYLTIGELKECCRLSGITPPDTDVYTFCFGDSPSGCCIQGVIPYSDAAMMGRMFGPTIILVRYPIFY